jgi:fructose-1,6-bisphosphatase
MVMPIQDQSKIITIERHILEGQRSFPEASGTLTALLYDIALAGKVIASNTTRGGLVGILGQTADMNVQGEQVMKLDRLADQIIYRLNDHTGRLAVMASEENAGLMPITGGYPTGKYVLMFDPLDGSSNIDVNVAIGTIFSIYRRNSESGPGTLEDCLQPGRDLVAAGYINSSVATMMVYSSGSGVHGFTLDKTVGEFLLSHPDIRIPKNAKYYSANQGYEKYWSEGIKHFSHHIQGLEGDDKPSVPWSGISTATCWQEASFTTRRIPRILPSLPVSFGCSTKPHRWHSWRSRRADMPRTGSSASWISYQPTCTSARRCTSAIARWWKWRRNISASMMNETRLTQLGNSNNQ